MLTIINPLICSFDLYLVCFLQIFTVLRGKKSIENISRFQVWIGEKRIIRDHTLVHGGFAPITLLFASGEGGSHSRSGVFSREQECGIG